MGTRKEYANSVLPFIVKSFLGGGAGRGDLCVIHLAFLYLYLEVGMTSYLSFGLKYRFHCLA